MANSPWSTAPCIKRTCSCKRIFTTRQRSGLLHIRHDGQNTSDVLPSTAAPCPAPRAKIYVFPKGRSYDLTKSARLDMGDVGPSSPDVRRVAMDALGRKTCGIGAYGQAVWSCPANAGTSLRDDLQATVAKKLVRRGDHGAAVTPLRRECRMMSAYLCWPRVRSLYFARKAVGASCTRHSLRPHFSRATNSCITRTQIASRECFCSSLRAERSNPSFHRWRYGLLRRLRSSQ
jgi:hypothetical protein